MNKSLIERMKKEGYRLVSIDLFSGPGGLCTGFKWAGILPLIAVEWVDSTVKTYSVSHNAEVMNLDKYRSKEGVADKEYLQTFMHETTRSLLIHGDINLVDDNLIKDLLLKRYGIDSQHETIDIVSGGAPCESFSLAGTRKIGDERDDLFSNIIRIARTVKTKSILFENVKGLFSKRDKNGNKGAIFNYICDTFENKNSFPSYRLASRKQEDILLKACDYGVPQVRERLFLVGIRTDLDGLEFSYPEKTHGPGCKYPFVTVEDAISDLPIVGMGEGSDFSTYKPLKSYKTINQKIFVSIMRGNYNENGIHSIVPQYLVEKGLYSDNGLSVHKGPGHIKRKQELLAIIPERSSMKATYEQLKKNGELDKYRHLFPNTIYGSRNRRLLWDEPSFTVTSHCLDEILHPTLNRAITPREAARLQSFPDWYQFAGPYVQFHGSKEQDKYEQIGDAIPPLLAHALGQQLSKCLPNHI
ncbi:MAG: DNA (cytosine-5-)-methyltransferase [Sharpea porci]|uniref:DNA cytosine methyltransferase n=1 Tax=Sharpea porci TaxID=2652286 RepID=UPI0024091BCB|nr:DNA (cytosine-5-)-methyltransferase [Sharpea porci]MDD6712232.1 DNA (cytosine-5-)-methyltransferase [Sharpea porci]